MLVVSDTTAITNLSQIKLLLIIKKLYGQVIIPQAVYNELSRYSNQKEIVDKQAWIKIKSIKNTALYQELRSKLDKGEAEAIVLSLETKADLLVIDEAEGRRIAREYGLRIIGLLGILVNAKRKKLIPAIAPYMRQLRDEIGFRISPALFEQILKQVGEK